MKKNISIWKPPDWQKNLVLIAKNTYVWLGQLSNKYNKDINHLNEIPDEELQRLQSLGITGLWLIGIWKRSPASRRIKELYGRTHLIASAYSILDYEVSEKLGGEQALTKLQTQAMDFGIRLACDMVPNHTGIDSDWVTEHPDWYISSDQKPVDSWQYHSPDLSRDSSAEIRIEDGYYSQIGAAETFQVRYKETDKVLFLYHGNDGTSMPWNDSAQLNYLIEDVRNAMKDTIVNVAKKYKIIRMDAAMTLIRKHFKRLWFPDKGGDRYIPTREANTMTQGEFDSLMPKEFWFEVMEELRKTAPDTLIMAEAFWLMEKYFIQELGMHRVYNSDFMNQLRDENNTELLYYFREILQSDPTTLEKFINYLTTPDEDTALIQFGKSEKYFGVCGLMAALPGLPMFGHGQINGYSEKYGMDFSNAFMSEEADTDFIEKHKKLITPLLKKRRDFSSVKNLRMFSFFSDGENANHNVFVFTNRTDESRSIIIFNNQNMPVHGFFRDSIHQILDASSGERGKVNILDALSIPVEKYAITLKDARTKLEIRLRLDDIQNGIHLDLEPYEFRVFNVNF